MSRTLFVLFAALSLTLTGCQSINLPGDSFALYGSSYHGKESLPAYFTNHYQVYQSSGHEFRGYRLKNRHWHF